MTQRNPGRRATSSPTVTGRQPGGFPVAVTGAASGLGAVLAERLVRHGWSVRGVDVLTGAVDGVDWREADVREPEVALHFDGVGALVHLAVAMSPDVDGAMRRDLNVRGTRTVLKAAAARGVAHVVLVTSAAVYGARADNPVPLDDDAPLSATPEGLLADLLEMEEIARDARAAHRGLRITIIRPAPLVGAGADSLVTRHFAAPRLLALRDVEMRWQFVHADDLASAIDLVLRGVVPDDEMTAGCEGWLSQHDVEIIAGRGHLEIPASLAFATAERLHRSGLTPAPASELAYVVYPWIVGSTRLRRAGWTPGYDNVTSLGALLSDLTGPALAGRQLGRADATLAGAGAAGATVAAVLGAAAFVRRARRARGR